MNYSHIARAIYNQPWAIMEDKLAAMVEFIDFKMRGGDFTAEEVQAKIGAAVSRPSSRTAGDVAVIPLLGVISQRMNMMTDVSGGTSTEKFTALFKQVLADPNIKAIVIDVDSPGGGISGVQELASEIFAARGQKKVVAVANSLAASAAYWIASAADEFVVTPSGEVGSIGVFAQHMDYSGAMEKEGVKSTFVKAGKYKAEGNPYEPLADDAKAALQARVDEIYGTFTKDVAKHRGVSASDVRGGFGEGRVVGAKQALDMGMVDRVATLDQTLARLGVSTTASVTRAEGIHPNVAAKYREMGVKL